MHLSRFGFLPVAAITLTGCGTFCNLKDRPTGPTFVATGSCNPFGGVARSALFAFAGPPTGLYKIVDGNIAILNGNIGPGFEEIGSGLLLTSNGLIAIVDTPLSLGGDILTFPIAYARSHEYPWASWWGEKSFHMLPPTTAACEDDTGSGRRDGE